MNCNSRKATLLYKREIRKKISNNFFGFFGRKTEKNQEKLILSVNSMWENFSNIIFPQTQQVINGCKEI